MVLSWYQTIPKPYQVASAATFKTLLGLYMRKGYHNHIFGVYLKKEHKQLTATRIDLFA